MPVKAILIFLVIVCVKVAPVQVRRAGPCRADRGSRSASSFPSDSLDCPGDPDRGPCPVVISLCPRGHRWKSFFNVRGSHFDQDARFSGRGSDARRRGFRFAVRSPGISDRSQKFLAGGPGALARQVSLIKRGAKKTPALTGVFLELIGYSINNHHTH